MTDPLIAAARFLASQLEWMRHAVDEQGQPYALGAFAEIAAAARVVAGIARGPAEQKFLGPCGAIHDRVAPTLGEPERSIEVECEGDVYGRVGAQHGTCRTCGATVRQDERIAWLDGEVRGHAFRAAHIADAYGVRANTIRVWAARGLLLEHGRDRDDRPLYNVGEVLDLAAADAARRAGEQAKRARRAAAKAEEASDAA